MADRGAGAWRFRRHRHQRVGARRQNDRRDRRRPRVRRGDPLFARGRSPGDRRWNRHGAAAVGPGARGGRQRRRVERLRLRAPRRARPAHGRRSRRTARAPRDGRQSAVSSRGRLRARRWPHPPRRRPAAHLREPERPRHRAVRGTAARGAAQTSAALARLDRARPRLRRASRGPLEQRRHTRRPRATRCRAHGVGRGPSMNASTGNPLLAFPELPRLDAVRAEHVKPAIDALIADARATIERVAADTAPPTWSTLVEPLADALDRLDRAWSIVNYLNAVMSTPAMRDAYHDNLPEVTALFTDLGQDERIFRRYKALRESAAFDALTAAERRVVDNEIRDFRLGGAELDANGKARFKAIQQSLAELAAKFDDNVLDATNAWSLVVDDVATLAGVPADVIAEARREARADGVDGWKLTLRSPCYFPVMQYAENRELRATLHRAYATRASELGANPAWDNTEVIARTLALRHEEARILGYANFAELSLVPKMAESPGDVLGFLRDLAERAKPFGERDWRELADFAARELGLAMLEPWDIAWASEKLKLSRYAFSDEDVKPYFTEPRVVAGLFGVVETLYEVTIREAEAPAWHPSVRFYEIRDRAG